MIYFLVLHQSRVFKDYQSNILIVIKYYIYGLLISNHLFNHFEKLSHVSSDVSLNHRRVDLVKSTIVI